MVLTQFELKSRCWSEDNQTMPVSTDILFQSDEAIVNQCLERNTGSNNGYRNLVSSNGYYGYQPLTASMKPEHFGTYNDCEMSMNCDNVQESATAMVISSSSPECKPISCQFQNIGVNQQMNQMTSFPAVSSRRKRTYDTNYDLKQCSKKSRQQDLCTSKKVCHTVQQTMHSNQIIQNTDDNWEILLHNIHGSSSYHWIQASLDLEFN